MPTRNVHLTEHFDSLIANGIESGQFSNASEVVSAGLRLLEQRQEEDKARIEWLRAAAQESIDAIERGDYTTLRSRTEISSFVVLAARGRSRDRAPTLRSANCRAGFSRHRRYLDVDRGAVWPRRSAALRDADRPGDRRPCGRPGAPNCEGAPGFDARALALSSCLQPRACAGRSGGQIATSFR